MRLSMIAVSVSVLALSACSEPAEVPSESPSAAAEPFVLGERPPTFAQCAACHTIEVGRNGIGPSLAGVSGAKAGHVGDFAYSSAMRASGLTWDEATLDMYLENPRGVVPGTKMSYPGMRDPQDRQKIIAYLKTL